MAVALVYVYALALPACLWAVMTYWAGIEGRTIPEIVNLYGYGLTVFVPVAARPPFSPTSPSSQTHHRLQLLSIPPISLLRFILSIVAFLLSLTFLLRNLYPVLASAPSKAARVLVLAIAFCHAVFALVLYFAFLGVGGAVPLDGGGEAVPKLPGDGAGEEVGDVPSPPRWLLI